MDIQYELVSAKTKITQFKDRKNDGQQHVDRILRWMRHIRDGVRRALNERDEQFLLDLWIIRTPHR